ncbi:DUF3800 domain-containing protein [Maricaulis maris]|uniref:DUF3800 domain-containing protein n=1 Tax=Maricaulis maris TaxID=74318 RepID=UPI0026EAA66C|nr:DUF3800 domain-containing protein [Maricaulis maris]
MKFAYVDESGDSGQSDVFTMSALLIDAVKLRKHTAKFDALLADFLAKHPKSPNELKTKALINGADKWSKVPAEDRKAFVATLIDLALECSTIFAVVLSFDQFNKTLEALGEPPSRKSYWLASAMLLAGTLQKHVQKYKNNKGLTVLIFDDNKQAMANLSEGLHRPNAWYDGLYQIQGKRRGKTVWVDRTDKDRFDHIVNTAFAIKSEHSSFVQVADAVSYVLRRHFELKTGGENWPGEKAYFDDLAMKVLSKTKGLGRVPKCDAVSFFEAAKHPDWQL